jgi:hypothetical protein
LAVAALLQLALEQPAQVAAILFLALLPQLAAALAVSMEIQTELLAKTAVLVVVAVIPNQVAQVAVALETRQVRRPLKAVTVELDQSRVLVAAVVLLLWVGLALLMVATVATEPHHLFLVRP